MTERLAEDYLNQVIVKKQLDASREAIERTIFTS